MEALREADLVLYKDELPDELQIQARQRKGYLNQTDILQLMKKGQKIVRLCQDAREPDAGLVSELRLVKQRGFRFNYAPNTETFHHLAWKLSLPWLSPESSGDIQHIQSLHCCDCRMFWYDLDHSNKTIVIDIDKQQRPFLVERMLWELSNPERPAALVDYIPTQHPVYWLTTLAELDEALTLWEPKGSTIIYIGQWPSRNTNKVVDSEGWRHRLGIGNKRFLVQLA
jgi:siroheme synthase